MAAKIVKKEVMNDEIKEFGEDAATAINELLGLYGYDDENKRNELSMKFHRNSCKKIASISQKLMESKRYSKGSDSESLRMSKMNDYSSISSDKDSSSREDSKSPLALKSVEKQENNCSWCHQSICPQSNEIIGSAGTLFCSENCFLFWRRASFKRAKTCDFCKNIRNAVSYVDFNDGSTQLQFCGDKCLNQYKMQIFCRETQAHLELNPHLKDKSDSGESLITPDLWLKNCRTRSPTPEHHHDVQSESPSHSPMTIAEEKLAMPKIIVTQQGQPSSSMKITSTVANLTQSDNAIDGGGKKPLINVLPSSKLLSRNMLHHKNLRKRRLSARLALTNKANQNSNGNNSSGSERIMNTNFPTDLRAKIHSQMNNSPKAIQSTSFNRPPLQQQFMQRPPINLFKFRLPFPMPTLPHRMPIPPHQQHHQQPPLPPDDSNLNPLPPVNSLVPPTVVLVPYPIPLPIVIPIPLPLTAFLRAYQSKESKLSSNKNDNESQEKISSQQQQQQQHHREEDMKEEGMNENEELPLDLSSEQGMCDAGDKNSVIHDVDDDEEDEDNNDADNIIVATEAPAFEEKSQSALINKIQELNAPHINNIKRANPKDKEYSSESNRPLRKRKIIATEVSESQ